MPEGRDEEAHEDVAHLLLSSSARGVERLVAGHLSERGYRPLALRGRAHLLPRVNWASPWDPAPEFRCFSLIGIEAPWVALTEELDLIDWELASALAADSTVWVLRGWQALEEYEWLSSSGAGEWGASSGPALSESSHRLLQLPYDEMLLKLCDPDVSFFGFTRGRPYAPGE